MKRSLVALTVLCLGLLPVFANAQAYFGFSLLSMEYGESDVEIATMENDDPLVTGTTYDDVELNKPVLIYTLAQDGGGDRPYRFIPQLDKDLKAFSFKYGYELNSLLSIELRGGFGVSAARLEDYTEEVRTEVNPALPVQYETNAGTTATAFPYSLTTLTEPMDSELRTEYYYGGYLRIGGSLKHLPVSPYVLVGHARLNFAVTDTSGTAGGKVRGKSVGAGLNIDLVGGNYINFEYLDLIDEDGIEVSSWSLGYEYRL